MYRLHVFCVSFNFLCKSAGKHTFRHSSHIRNTCVNMKKIKHVNNVISVSEDVQDLYPEIREQLSFFYLSF